MKRSHSALPALFSLLAIASCTAGPADREVAGREEITRTVSAALSSSVVATWRDINPSGCVCPALAGGGYSNLFAGQSSTKTFDDPVPAGMCVTAVSVDLSGTYCSSSALELKINGTSIGTGALTSGACTCSGCATTTFSRAFATGLPGYVYGGSNSLVVTALAGNQQSALSHAATTLTYEAVGTTTTTLASATNPARFGQSVTLMAHVTGTAGTPTGKVTFKEGAQTLGQGTLDGAGDATFTTAALAVGSHAVTATYESSSCEFPTSTSASVTEVVDRAATAAGLTTSQSPSTVGGSVTLTAELKAVAPGAGTPVGAVTFLDGARTLGTANLDGTGHATFTTTAFAVGDHALTATYGETTSYEGSSSASVTQKVGQDTGTTSLGATPNPSVFGSPVTFKATVSTGSTGGVPTGDVVFKEGATVLDTVALVNGSASYTTSALPGGSHTITAGYAGDTNHGAALDATATAQVDPAASTTALASSVSPSKIGQSVTFTATPSSTVAGTLDGTVTFTEGATLLGTSTIADGKATFTTAALATGSHDVVATYGGNGNFGGSVSGATTQAVEAAQTTTSLVASASPALFGSALSITATVAPVAPGAGMPTGTVTFKEGATTLGTGSLANGKATYTTSTFAVGTHLVTASYGATTDYGTSTSAPLSAVVSANAANGVLRGSPNPATFGAPVALTATFSGSAGVPTGVITFAEDRDGVVTTLGTANLADGVASFSVPGLAVGNHTLLARFPGNAAYAATTAEIVQAVGKAATAIAITSSANPSDVATPPTFTAAVTSSAAGMTGTVDFYDGVTKLGTSEIDGNGNASLVSGPLEIGGHAIGARYTGDAQHDMSSAPALVQNVGQAATPAPDAGATAKDAGSVAASSTVTTSVGGGGCSSGAKGVGSPLAGFALGVLALLGVRRRRS